MHGLAILLRSLPKTYFFLLFLGSLVEPGGLPRVAGGFFTGGAIELLLES